MQLSVRRHDHARLSRHGTRVSDLHVLSYVEHGHIDLEQNGAFRAGPGALLASPAGVPHQALGGRDVTLHMVAFLPTSYELHEGLPLMAPFARVRHGALPYIQVPRVRQARIRDLLDDLASESERRHAASPSLVQAGIHLLLGEALRAEPTPSAIGSTTLGAQAIAFIQRHALEPIALSDVAAAVHRSPKHVATVVKRQTGRTVGDWIASIRLTEASARLLQTDASVAAVGEAVGWADPTHFIRRFRRRHGMTPAQWRARERRQLPPG